MSKAKRDREQTALKHDNINLADTAFADFMQTLATEPSESLWCASVLASASVQNGDVCVTLSDVASFMNDKDVAALHAELQASGVVQTSSVLQEADMPVTSPLVLDSPVANSVNGPDKQSDRLFLSRYWQAEHALAEALLARLQNKVDESETSPSVEFLDQLFPPQAQQSDPDWQRVAAVVATRQRLCVITGGPGTGKTRTVARLLAVLQAQLSQTQRIALLAPTGKAAARLLESLRKEVGELNQQDLQLELPDTASTLHRALGYQPGRQGFRHNAGFPLPYDVVLVDEASMVDLTLMHSLVTALATDTRLILLGDRDQLASVEAGNVLGDIVGDASPGRYSKVQRTALTGCCEGIEHIVVKEPTGGMADAVVELQHSYRFNEQSGIGHFARAVNTDDADAACAVGHSATYSDLSFIDPATTSLQSHLLAHAVPAALRVIKSPCIKEALANSLAYRVLCALHKGPRGVDQVNQLIESRLVRLGQSQPNQLWYKGRPLLITRNDPGTGLYNGDTGLIWPDDNGHMMAWFADGEGAARAIAPGRLPAHQTCYAMTVHKTQGSEFTHVLLVLPDASHSLLSRDLLYTGITRARRSAEVFSSEEAIRKAIETKRVRASGLRDRLWGG